MQRTALRAAADAERYTAFKPSSKNRSPSPRVYASVTPSSSSAELMATADKIAEYVRLLPERLQAEVLDFVSFLLAKGNYNEADPDLSEWNRFSLESAMRGMEADDEPEYGEGDLKESFS